MVSEQMLYTFTPMSMPLATRPRIEAAHAWTLRQNTDKLTQYYTCTHVRSKGERDFHHVSLAVGL